MSENRREERRPGGPGHGPAGRFAPRPKVKNAKGTLLRLLGYLARHKWVLMVVLLITLVNNAIPIIGTRMIGDIIDRYIINFDIVGLGKACLVLLGIYLVNVVLSYTINRMMVRINTSTVRRLRSDLFGSMQNLPIKHFDQNTHGDLMSRFTNDVDNVANMLGQGLGQTIGNLISIIGTLIAMLWLSPVMTVISLLSVPLLLLFTGFIGKRAGKLYTAQQKTLGALNGYVEETISGQHVVKVFNREEQSEEQFAKINAELQDVAIKANIYSGVMGPFSNLINHFGFVVVTSVGAWLVLTGRFGITVGMLFTFVLYHRQFGMPINQLAQLYTMILSGLAGAERIFGLMDEDPEPADRPDAKKLEDVRGDVEATSVNFSYQSDQPILRDNNFRAKPGQTIALVGPTGAGKTTIVNLMTRFYDVDSGSIKIDGIDLRDVQRDSLRSSMGIVLQDTVLFSETVRENIRYGRLDATDEEVERAARMANADQFITRLPHGYDTVLAGEGGTLSQGQQQLLSIARAILADPAILILDEATSSVDTRTELHIQQAMMELMEGRTSFVIAHRLSTIQGADQILVINDGEIVERGTHDELLKQDGFYANLYNSQFRTGLAI